ncbi:pyridoxamine 5-phosphate oxidase [Tenacibaculum holothuriorum]|uniref:Pyridoxamine 5-phosphate oxidase n=1 Tax=Tenacibaculum holothuriorum TaxID=1635173 RepID=A0A1Y2P9A7_9FLAO|nr:DegT/DnrJ/EryC1/StrS family aminotransferase [Tenacibaculum holothuriorum]OSY87026.1 pyridoxamine 5-phosphate oxidase [Tenacibaculum holothuriorum]
MKYPLASSSWDHKELDAIQSVINRDMYTMGKSVLEFEQQFAEYVNSKYAVMVNSGSSANLLAVAALFYTKTHKLKRGDEVIVPAVSWSTTYYPLYQYGLKLKFVDIDLETLNFDLDALERAVTEKTKMIFAVNLLGNSNDYNRINKIIGSNDIILLEDNCESMGAEFNGKQTGTFGLMGTYSTFFSHHMATMEGGLICTDNEELYHILLSIRSHGWTRHLPQENSLVTKSTNPFEESFRFILPGYNVRPVEMSGAIGIEQLKKLPSFIETRRKNAQYFQELFQKHPDFYIQKEIGNSSWFGFSLIIKPNSKLTREVVVKKLQENQIDCRPIVTGNFANKEVVKYFDYEVFESLKNADYIDRNGLFVGNHQIQLKQEIEHLYKVLS